MARPLPPLNALRAFEVIARHMSFAKAAEELHVTPAALSHQIKGLEDQLGLSLFHRRTRAIELTEAGRMLYPGLHAGFEAVREAVARLDRARQDRVLVVSATPGLTAKWLVPRLWRFLAAHPDIDARIQASMSYADFGSDGVDVAIRLSNGKHPDLHVEELMEDCMLPLCSPKLLAEGLKTPHDLARFTLIHYDVPLANPMPPLWTDWLRAAGVEGIDPTRGLHVNAADHAIDAAASGAGVALSFKILASDDVHASGRRSSRRTSAISSPAPRATRHAPRCVPSATGCSPRWPTPRRAGRRWSARRRDGADRLRRLCSFLYDAPCP
jgi:LysR family transcriptional regulator, glycine cleavage system transcriptional activator